jgi:hypothetical protein
MLGAARRGLLGLYAALLFASAALGQTIGPDLNAVPRALAVQQILSWLPSDTETVTVAKGTFSLSDFDNAGGNREFEIETALRLMVFLPSAFKNGSLFEYFREQPTTVALQGSRHFRAPMSLGLMPFEGCTVIVLADDSSQRTDTFFTSPLGGAAKVEEVEGQKVVVLQERNESGLWTIFETFVRPNILLKATNLDYLRETLARMHGKSGPRALPETLPEWKFVNTDAQFWALRHFDKSQGDSDPSSPFWDPKKFVKSPWNDTQAIGLTFSYDPAGGGGPTVTYLSGNPSIARKPLAMSEGGHTVNVAFRELNAGAIEAAYGLDQSTLRIFTFVLLYLLGHGIFL